MNLEIVSVVVFLGLVGILAIRDRKNIEFKYGLLVRRSNKGKKTVSDFAKKHQKKLRLVGSIGVVVGIIVSLYGLHLLVSSSLDLLLKPEKTIQPLKLVLPSISGIKFPGFILGIPFWYWILGAFTLVIIHEGMHGLLARAENIEIKSFGVFLFLFLPGAFVDPDEDQLKKSSTVKKLRIYAAGSFGNFMLAGVVLVLLAGYQFALSNFLIPSGVIFDKTVENTPAYEIGLNGVIIEINGVSVKSINDFAKVVENTKPNDIIEVKTTSGVFNMKTIQHPDNPEKPFIGIEKPRTTFVYGSVFRSYGDVSERTINVLAWFDGLFMWMFVLNLGVGTFNLFPLKPLDGGLMLEEIIKYFFKGKSVKFVVNGISVLTLLLVLVNLFGNSILNLIG